ncbi:UvrB/UvrC motif-containing protein [Gemmatimonadota bacterium]
MLCEDCRQRVATVIYTEVTEGVKEVRHLCRQCVEERGIHAPDLKNPLDNELPMEGVGGVPDTDNGVAGGDEDDGPLCEHCGWSWGRFQKTGRLGCPACYDTFQEELKGLLRQVHGSNEHLGKSYEGADYEETEDIAALQQALDGAVKEEEFERAAGLRDRIRRLKRRSG